MSKRTPILHFCAFVVDNARHGNAEVLFPPIRTLDDVRLVEQRIAAKVLSERQGGALPPSISLSYWRTFDR